MTRALRILLLLAFCPLALATEPTPSVPQPAQTADANASASGNTGIDPNEDRRLRNMGYKPEKLKGETVYCRSELPVGSRLPQKTCMSAVRHGDLTRESREATERLQRNFGNIHSK